MTKKLQSIDNLLNKHLLKNLKELSENVRTSIQKMEQSAAEKHEIIERELKQKFAQIKEDIKTSSDAIKT